ELLDLGHARRRALDLQVGDPRRALWRPGRRRRPVAADRVVADRDHGVGIARGRDLLGLPAEQLAEEALRLARLEARVLEPHESAGRDLVHGAPPPSFYRGCGGAATIAAALKSPEHAVDHGSAAPGLRLERLELAAQALVDALDLGGVR